MAPKLRPGDRVRFVSPASPVPVGGLARSAVALEQLGLRVEYGAHVHDVHDTIDYLAGSDEDRLADLNDALRDPRVAAVIATRGGKGAYRIADGLDFEAARRHPKLLIGFSEVTILHLALLQRCGLAGIHGAAWDAGRFGDRAAASFVQAVTSTEPITVHATTDEHTHALTTHGRAEGVLIGGNQDSIATGAGWALPSFDGAILLLEAVNLRLGHIDRQLTMLIKTGILADVVGVAVGQYTGCGAATDPTTDVECTEIDVLRDRLGLLGVPILGGLPIGHGKNPVAVPIGTHAVLDADARSLTISNE
ncbi:S66 peptidase family protein [Jiangella anatolica]|uniref:LD-carboxypeptidase n=1 Tax=Jiangella anatolica TaxID=2670374 RepID=A0A2W2C163_9ACTN|nr:LD-carboxypeptidase [Jiangella anatolica]PZF81707.1 LD-carboxypeptidase [Jiangella anatolica]